MNTTAFRIAICAAMLFVSCGGTEGARPVEGTLILQLEGAPQWVLMGWAGYGEAPARLCGVGSASDTVDNFMLYSMAFARMGRDLERNLTKWVRAHHKIDRYDYHGWGSGGEGYGVKSNDGQELADIARQLHKSSIEGHIRRLHTRSGRAIMRIIAYGG